MAPTIGITFSSNIRNNPSNNYIKAIKDFGGIPITLYPGVSKDAYADLNGLLLTGGPDIDPRYYGEETHETTDIHPYRDRLELPLFELTTKLFSNSRYIKAIKDFGGIPITLYPGASNKR